jgi:lysozyme family protein
MSGLFHGNHMMHPFDALAPEYLDLLGRMKITRETDAQAAAARIIKLMPRYKAVSTKTGVPAAWLAAVNERESSSCLSTYLGNGDRLTAKTRHVPAGRGPFATWEAGAEDALALDKISAVALADWRWARACYLAELWNGFGYRARGIHSPYLWSGTSIPCEGKFVSDGQFAAGVQDSQLGIVPLALALIDLDPSLALPGWPANKPWPSIPVPAAAPAGHDGGDHGTLWLQESLNTLVDAGLLDDGSFGRRTAAAVRQFQEANGLEVDGLCGPNTIAKIEARLAAIPPINALVLPANPTPTA